MSKRSSKFIILEKVDSTNNYAMAMVKNNDAMAGDTVFAEEQTAGKGRRGKLWESSPRKNIVMSIVEQMQWLPANDHFKLSVAVATACLDFVSKYITQNLKIKWPNDIFINDRKAGGILIQNIVKGNLWQWAIIGVGINVNQINFSNAKIKATSLKKITQADYDVVKLSQQLSGIIHQQIQKIKEQKFEVLLSQYNENLYCRNKIVKLKKGPIVFNTRIKQVSSTGQLITKDAMEREFEFDEVEWQID
jgi:BirA family biotin operon repressor/biotin-[acetyl-CoA-carboxylase] ligase